MSRGTLPQRARASLVAAASSVSGHLPEGPQTRAAQALGNAWYRLAPGRAARARANLRRVCTDLARTGRGGPAVRAAATDPAALERLVRSAFRHGARYYLEVARTPSIHADDLRTRLVVENPEVVTGAVAPGRPVIFVGLHFGSLELPSLFLAANRGTAVAPMETIGDPALQAYFVRSRGAAGVQIVGLREARRVLLDALRNGGAVGLVGDRDLTGGGVLVDLFGSPARLPLGPALLAVESGAAMYVTGVRRAGIGRYVGRADQVNVPDSGSRRERVEATTKALAAAFERVVSDAPDQWWAVFFPIWPDLAPEDRATAAARLREAAA
ncbi:MAG: lysophospholipid acyltransferase family protein [Chloroflexota bacterium]